MKQLQGMLAFVEAASSGSLTAAAERLEDPVARDVVPEQRVGGAERRLTDRCRCAPGVRLSWSGLTRQRPCAAAATRVELGVARSAPEALDGSAHDRSTPFAQVSASRSSGPKCKLAVAVESDLSARTFTSFRAVLWLDLEQGLLQTAE